MGGVGLLETPLGVLRSFCFTIAKRGFWLGARMKSVGEAPVCEETPLRISAALGKVLAADVLSCISTKTQGFLKCRWFFGRVFSFPLVEEFV